MFTIGLSPEDRVTLKKTYKLLVENVQAEDVIDRLQQSQVVKFSDRQEVLSVSKKQERMQVIYMFTDMLSEVWRRKPNFCFDIMYISVIFSSDISI